MDSNYAAISFVKEVQEFRKTFFAHFLVILDQNFFFEKKGKKIPRYN
jgi:hypothetical protein